MTLLRFRASFPWLASVCSGQAAMQSDLGSAHYRLDRSALSLVPCFKIHLVSEVSLSGAVAIHVVGTPRVDVFTFVCDVATGAQEMALEESSTTDGAIMGRVRFVN
jgi:hypothetical protein